jgi:Fe2+ or Zn2+ uptake regulation protein
MSPGHRHDEDCCGAGSGDRVETALLRMKEKALRITAPRLTMLRVLAGAKHPLSAEQIHEAAGDDKLDLVTVYRSLVAMDDAGIVQRHPLERGRSLYALVTPGHHHHHVICRRCGRIERLPGCDSSRRGRRQGQGLRRADARDGSLRHRPRLRPPLPMPDFPRTAFLLGAGLGTRLRPLTENRPKPLLPIGGRPMAPPGDGEARAAGTRRFLINTHHCPEAWTVAFPDGRFGDAEVKLVHEPVLLETGGGLANVAGLLGPD